MNNNAIMTLVAVIAVIIGGYFIYQNYAESPSATRKADTEVTSKGGATSTDASIADDEEEVKEFTVTGKPFSFSPSTVTVDRGDKVRIIFKNESGMHNFVIDQFDARTPVIAGGATATVEFTAGSAGTYDFYCGVGNHRAQGMEGTFTVR